MNILMLSAMYDEIELFLDTLDSLDDISLDFYSAYSLKLYTYNGHKIYLGYTKVGKINATFFTTFLISKYNIDKVIFFGTAGARINYYVPGDCVAIKRFAQSDADITIMGKNRGQLSDKEDYIIETPSSIIKIASNVASDLNYKLFVDNIATSDHFVADEDEMEDIYNTFTAPLVDMESYAVAQIAREFNIDCVVLKVVSDCVAKGGEEVFRKNVKDYSSKVANLAYHIAKNYCL